MWILRHLKNERLADNKGFTLIEIAIVLDDKTIAKAKGKSKKEAQQRAAGIALKKLQGLE